MALDPKRPVDGGQDARRHDSGALGAAQPLLDQRELVATQPGPGVRGARHGGEPARHLAQERVADRVAQGVVDLLEVVEVEQHHRHGIAAAPGARQRSGQPIVEQHAVGQAGQGIMQCQVADLLLGGLALADVDGSPHGTADHAVGVTDRRGADQLVVEGAVVEDDAQFLVANDLAAGGALQGQALRRQFAPAPEGRENAPAAPRPRR